MSAESNGAEKKRASESLPPSGEEIIHALVVNHDVSLGVHESCPGAWSGLAGQTIGDYFSAVMAASITEDFEGTKLKISAAPDVWPPTNEKGWRCEVLWRDDRPEVLWSRGLTFFMKARDRSVIRDSFTCPGTP
jgi:hypothetical protein